MTDSRPTPLPCLVLVALATLSAPAPARGQAAPVTCEAPEFRQFDFWVGDWEVRGADGSLAGENTITSILGGCVIHESWRGSRGVDGRSFNIFDRSRGVWHQTWVDGRGTLLVLEGSFRDGAMVLEGTTTDQGGAVVRQRITWRVVDDDPDGVRQRWESSRDGGTTWNTVFDGLYVRKGG